MEKQINNVEEIIKLLNLDENDRISLINDVLAGDLVLSTKALQLMKQISQKQEQKQTQEPTFELFNDTINKSIRAAIQFGEMLWVSTDTGYIHIFNSNSAIVK